MPTVNIERKIDLGFHALYTYICTYMYDRYRYVNIYIHIIYTYIYIHTRVSMIMYVYIYIHTHMVTIDGIDVLMIEETI